MKSDNKWFPFLGTTWCIAVIGAVICGVLECFGVNTGAIGLIFGIITVLPIPLALLWFLFCCILHWIFPGWEKEKVHKIGIYTLIFIIINLLWAVLI